MYTHVLFYNYYYTEASTPLKSKTLLEHNKVLKSITLLEHNKLSYLE